MIQIEGYKILNEIYNGNNTIIYKAIEEAENLPVVIKLLKSEYPTSEELKDFEYEYKIAKNLDNIKGIIKNYKLIEYKNTKAIILEDFGGSSIDKIIKTKKINIKSFLVIAIKAVEILGEIHRNNIIHKDIKPQNILLNAESGEVKFIDFGISSQLTKEMQKVINPDSLEGTLAYISPEQTGRMNRSIDYRTDFYSLGVTFYELLTKQLPFSATDPIELVHSHIAKTAPTPNSINQDTPEVLSNIIMKLLEKTAESRYQSAFGIKADLEKCYTMLKEQGTITSFEIALNDISDRFQIPEKLYGRENDIAHLMEIFNTAADGNKEILFFSGISGIGKSALINEVHKPMVEKKGYFISGKHDQFKKNIPYTAIIQAFQDLIKQIVTENDEKVKKWKSEILEAVGSNGKVITSVIPSIELIIGPQPDVQELPPTEAQNRFNLIFQNLVKVFSSQKHPLVLFLDDLQWADSASINLLEVLMNDTELNHFLFIGSFRDNEVDASHPLALMQERLKKAQIKWKDIKVTPLVEEDISNLILDTLNLKSKKIDELAKLVHAKTGGNPFFVIEFLKSLNDNSLLYFKNGWKWNFNKIKEMGITNNVIELMATKIQKLPENTLNAMKIACCIGVKFYLDTLSVVYGKTPEECYNDLKKAINEGMIIKIDNDIKFVHDKVREATYTLLSQEEQAKLHYKIGKCLLNNTKNKTDEMIFSITNQWNLCQELLSAEEQKELIDLNIKAGTTAKSSSAFEAASKYFRNAQKLINDNSWETDYKKTLNLYTNLSEVEYLSLNFEEANKIVDYIISKAKETLDKVPAYAIRCTNYTFQKKYPEAINVGLEVLKELHEKLPQKASTLSILLEFIKLKTILSKKKVSDLANLPKMKNKEKMYAVDIISQLIAPTQVADKNLMGLIILRGTITSIKYGNCQQSALMYALCGYLMTAMGDLRSGAEFIELGVKVGEQFGVSKFRGRAIFTAYAVISAIKRPLNDTEDLFSQAKNILVDTGDFEYLSYLHLVYARLNSYSGTNLNQSKAKLLKVIKLIKKLKIPTSIIAFSQSLQAIVNLSGESDDILKLNGEFFNEDEKIPELIETSDTQNLAFFYIYKLVIYYIFGKYNESLTYWDKLQGELLNTVAGQDCWFTVQIYNILSLMQLTQDGEISKKKAIKQITNFQKVIKKWNFINPYNYKNKYLLICAELAHITGTSVKVATAQNQKGKTITTKMDAIELYDLAIKESRNSKFTQEEAIANECAAKYYLSIGAEKAAAAYMQEARYCYEKWGCIPKIEQLDQKYPDLLAGMQLRAGGTNMMAGTLKATTISTASTSKVSTGPTTSFLDMGTIMKSSQTLAGEIEMKSLLTKMIKILIENAGAQKGLLILANDAGKLFIEAEGDVNKEDVAVLQSIPLDECSSLSPAIVRYVAKTKENVVLDNATTDSTYANDQYIKEQKPLSVICTPIINQGRVVAILYLENNLSPAAFTENRIEVLNVLSTQAAISIENARLIEGMKEKERLKQEMEIAERIQTSLVPPAPKNEELDIAVCMEPAEEVGGDYYDVLYDQENKLWFAIGDVTGHGVTPGLIMMMAATSFNTDVIGSKGKTPRDAMITVNQVLTQNVRKRLKETHFMTMSFMKYDEGGKFTYTGAHCDIVVFRKKTGKCDLYETKGIYLGIKADISKVTLDKEFDIDVDDIVVIYTDGVIESRHKDDRNKLMGMDILQDIIIENSNNDADTIMEAIKTAALEWCDYKPDDDITMVVAKRTK